jgi:hypothetical protein
MWLIRALTDAGEDSDGCLRSQHLSPEIHTIRVVKSMWLIRALTDAREDSDGCSWLNLPGKD